MVADGDLRRATDVLSHDIGPFPVDGEAEFGACYRKAVDEPQESFLSVESEGNVICKVHILDKDLTHHRLCSKGGHVEDVLVTHIV